LSNNNKISKILKYWIKIEKYLKKNSYNLISKAAYLLLKCNFTIIKNSCFHSTLLLSMGLVQTTPYFLILNTKDKLLSMSLRHQESPRAI